MSWCPGLLISHHRPGQARSRKRKCLTGNKMPLLCNRTGNARRRQTGGDRYKADEGQPSNALMVALREIRIRKDK